MRQVLIFCLYIDFGPKLQYIVTMLLFNHYKSDSKPQNPATKEHIAGATHQKHGLFGLFDGFLLIESPSKSKQGESKETVAAATEDHNDQMFQTNFSYKDPAELLNHHDRIGQKKVYEQYLYYWTGLLSVWRSEIL